ncbi:MAG TPA: hypothetical protein VGO00_10555 [Kofleriaceae bacterium]|nr:hypothetical protein [Kofleriaceae bacterium]
MKPYLVVSLALAVTAGTAHAVPYETFIDVDSEADLQDLLAAQEITQDTFDELIDLLDSGVDLTTADRGELYTLPNLTYEDVDAIIAYRDKQNGIIKNPADLVTAGALTQEKLLSISAFILTRDPGESPLAAHGHLLAETRYTAGDDKAPPWGLRGRFTALKHLTAGFAATGTRLWIGDPVFDPNRNALIADGTSLQIHVPKAYVKWEDDQVTAIAGSYRAGFAQRLVFDNSRHYSPNGLYLDDQLFYSADLALECREFSGELGASPCAGPAGSRYVTPDFQWRDGLFGAGVGAKHFDIGSGWLQAYAFASASRRSLYEYELVDRTNCPDPHDDADPACAAPTVYKRPNGSILTPTSQFGYETLPNVFGEKLVGGNVTYFADRRSSVGLTAYGATETNLVRGMDLDFQEWSRLPTGKNFQAAGVNFAFGRGWLDVFGEAAVSHDDEPRSSTNAANGGGGPAGILRITATKKHEELEAVFRYYSTDYLNPYARPISQPDEFDGQRARDEMGGRLRYTNTNKQYTVRALLDLWVPPSTFSNDPLKNPAGHVTPKIDTYIRTDVQTTHELRLGLWLRYQDKDLDASGHDQCFEVTTDTSLTGEPVPCSGRQLTTILRAAYRPEATLSGEVLFEHQLLDDNANPAYLNKFRQDVAAWAILLYKPSARFRLRARVRYFDEAIDQDAYLEKSISGLVDAAMQIRRRDVLRLRVDTKYWLDDRTSTGVRTPNPELTFWLTYDLRL